MHGQQLEPVVDGSRHPQRVCISAAPTTTLATPVVNN